MDGSFFARSLRGNLLPSGPPVFVELGLQLSGTLRSGFRGSSSRPVQNQGGRLSRGVGGGTPEGPFRTEELIRRLRDAGRSRVEDCLFTEIDRRPEPEKGAGRCGVDSRRQG